MKQIIFLLIFAMCNQAFARTMTLKVDAQVWGQFLGDYDTNSDQTVDQIFKQGWVVTEKSELLVEPPAPVDGEEPAPPEEVQAQTLVIKSLADWKKAGERRILDRSFSFSKKVNINNSADLKLGSVNFTIKGGESLRISFNDAQEFSSEFFFSKTKNKSLKQDSIYNVHLNYGKPGETPSGIKAAMSLN